MQNLFDISPLNVNNIVIKDKTKSLSSREEDCMVLDDQKEKKKKKRVIAKMQEKFAQTKLALCKTK